MGSNVTAPQLSDPIAIPGTTASMPRPGFGVYKIPASVCNEACLTALDAGYRHIDCAQLYRTESHVGEAARESPIPRSEIFLTTKVKKCGGIRQPTVIYEQLLDSVTKIGGHDGYVDLFLIHTPRFDGWTLREAWTCLERLFREGRARAIGVSNFGIGHIEDMKAYAEIWPPHVIQIEVESRRTIVLLIL
jgi:diketogulonate reductase-like aldo/keto reductase